MCSAFCVAVGDFVIDDGVEVEAAAADAARKRIDRNMVEIV